MSGPVVGESNEGHLPSFEGATAWLHSRPLAPTDLLGRVVVVNFCTYTCINWLRSLPYVRAWARKYEPAGLVTIGVHTPEFSFEHDIDNVRAALAQMDVTYPVAMDNDHGVWDAFANRYWPALYFVDAQGRIRHQRFGEGDDERSELAIQDLLTEAGANGARTDLVSVMGKGPEAGADWEDLLTPETYLGSDRTMNFASPGGMKHERPRAYEGPEQLEVNHWSLVGDWTVGPESVVLDQPNGRIELAFHARDVHLVMGPAERGTSVPFRVTLDGKPSIDASGSDVDDEGAGVLEQQRLYQLLRQRGPIVDRVFAIEFLDRGAEAFAFTFG
jgi:hypothetical protein